MPGNSVEIIGLTRLMGIINRAVEGGALRPSLQAAGLFVQHQMQVYPPPPRGIPYPFVSEKQRRYVMMLAAAGMLPYRRTTVLQRRWTVEMRGSGWDTSAVVGNNTPYGPYVQSSEAQARYHAGRWRTEMQVLNLYEAVIQGIVERELAQRLEFD